MAGFAKDDVDKFSWFCKMDLGNGVYTPGSVDPVTRIRKYQFPKDLTGWSVLDIGAFEGYCSFECERLGAERVVALDSGEWAWKNRTRDGKLSGKQAFDFAREALQSKVEDITMDVYDISPEKVGTFDLVLFLGVLYHLKHPLLALEHVASVTESHLIIETHTNLNHIEEPAMAFYPDRWNNDPTNWCGPNKACVEAMLRDVGFFGVRLVYADNAAEYPIPTWHAWK